MAVATLVNGPKHTSVKLPNEKTNHFYSDLLREDIKCYIVGYRNI